MSETIPIDPALTANEEAFRSSLSGIFPSSSSTTMPQEQQQRGSLSLGGESIAGVDYTTGVDVDQDAREAAATSGGNKKRKKSTTATLNEGDEDKPKKSRQSQSCDACRSRKVKCDRPPPGGTSSDLPPKDICTHCAHLSLACTFDYVPKKRGPPNLYLRKLKEDGHEGSMPPGTPPTRPSVKREGESSSSVVSSSPQIARRPSHGSFADYSQSSHAHPQSHNPYLSSKPFYHRSPSQPSVSESAMRGGQATGYSMSGGLSGSYGTNDDWSSDTVVNLASASHVSSGSKPPPNGSHTEYNPYPSPRTTTHRPSFSGAGQQSLPPVPSFNSSSSPLNSKASPGYPQYAHYPHNPNNPFDQVLPRGLLYHIVDLYFDYIYALIPCLHKPSFMASLHDGREERQGEEEWIALVMAVLAGTLVQVPHAFLAIPKEEKKSLVEKCYAVVKAFLIKEFTEVTVSRCIIYYMSGFTVRVLGYPSVASMHFACNAALVIRMRLNEENTYQNLSPVYRELCRRIFWLTYGGDKSMASMDGEAVMIHEDECADVALPAEVDDEYVGDSSYLEQPVGRTSVISGFIYISKLFRLIGQFLNKKRSDRRQPLSGVMLQMRLNEIADLYERVQTLMDDCPDALRLDTDSDNKSVGSLPDDWDIHASADVHNLFSDPKAPKAVVRDAYLVQQSNIYVTQQMARQMILQYRDELLALQANELALQSSSNDHGGGRRMAEWTKALIPDDKDQIASDLLCILQKIPVSVIAVNSTSMMGKIRFVASGLLDTLAVQSGDGNGNTSELPLRLQKAQNYLWDFLRILSEIEALYLLCDDQKGQLIR